MSEDFPATDWTRYDVPTIASMLRADDYTESWNQVFAWRTAYETIVDHQKQLRTAHAELAEAWPPEHSPAAASYLDFVQVVNNSMTATADAAAANETALSNVLNALTEAQAMIYRLNQTWQLQVPQGAAASSAYSPTTQAAQQAAALNSQAHKIMRDTDQIVLENTRRMWPPPIMGSVRFEPHKAIPIPIHQDLTRRSGVTTSIAPLVPTNARLHAGELASANSGHSVLAKESTSAGNALDGIRPLGSSPITAIGAGVLGAAVDSRTLRDGGSELAAVNGSDGNPEPGILGRSALSQATGTGNQRARAGGSSRVSGEPASANEQRTATAEGTAAHEQGGMLSPGMGGASWANGSSRSARRRRGRPLLLPDARTVSGLIVPRDEQPIVHDPGPGVIGLDR